MSVLDTIQSIRDLGYDLNISVTEHGFKVSADIDADGWYKEYSVTDEALATALNKLATLLEDK
jgi:hypothetical protein